MKMLSSYPLLLMSVIISSCLWRPSELRKHKDDCIHRCGNINIPYPFGLDTAKKCFRDPNFAVSCNSSSSSQPKPFLKKLNLEILEVRPDFKWGLVTVKIPSFTTCSSRNDRTVTSHNLANSPFKYSVTENVFVSVGCDGYALLLDETGGVVAGCASVCTLQPPAAVLRGNRCIGYRCCQAQFARLNYTYETMYEPDTEIKKYSISVSTNNISGNCRSAFLISQEYLEANASLSSAIAAVPVVLQWESGYTTGESDDTVLRVLYILQFSLPAVGISLIICGSCWGCWRFKTKKKRKEIKLRAKYFKDKQGSSNSDVTEKTKLFTLTELKRYTDNFSKDRVLGQGGQGTVYKGMLKDCQVIAVKRSRALEESQWKQFINEVILLSQIKHRHVVKILGCCLEDDIPLVVYEFICNGTLSEHIQTPVTWEMRLNIAFETATAISYLHSEFSTPIYHRDIKSSNILLDDKFGAKLSDFGISRAVSVEQTHLTTCVQGTFGYLDPEYFYSGQYSEKSDVYSFGVILVELLTGQKPIRALGPIDKDEEIEDEDERSLAMYFVSSMNDNTLFEILDPLVLEGSKKEDVVEFANLAKQCLYPTGLERPTMKEVTMVLERLRYRNSSCTRPLTPIDQAKGLTTRISSMITSSMETDNAFLRSVTYDHIDLTTNSDSADVEMHLLHTC